ncbi:LEC14B like [Dissostichus eleginoides]|uniref:LEC14B like n=1 Tax=Dissostichus eleginoides TaxID=100907 RepID=A0AAD9BA70_DISEL|nr:LEC14B like [Dissostichus eleginoides]
MLFTYAALTGREQAFGNKMEEGEALIMAPHIPESERSAWRPQQMTAAAFPSLMRMLLVVEMVSGEDSQKGGRGRYGMEMSRGT